MTHPAMTGAEMGHTPTPWHVGEGLYATDIFDAEGFRVSDTDRISITEKYYAGSMGSGHWGTTPGSHIDRTPEEQLANAAFIVTACNNHASLTSSLEQRDQRIRELEGVLHEIFSEEMLHVMDEWPDTKTVIGHIDLRALRAARAVLQPRGEE